MEKRRCTKCKKRKPLDAFHKNEKYRCSACKNAYCKRWYDANPEKVKASAKRKNKDPKYKKRVSEYRKVRRRKGGVAHEAEKMRNFRQRLKRLGITREQYNALLIKQDGCCAICKLPESRLKAGRVKRLTIDHDHATGHVRGLLCHLCNCGIGCFRDSPELLQAVIAYLTVKQ
jgi:hypothetical protein